MIINSGFLREDLGKRSGASVNPRFVVYVRPFSLSPVAYRCHVTIFRMCQHRLNCLASQLPYFDWGPTSHILFPALKVGVARMPVKLQPRLEHGVYE